MRVSLLKKDKPLKHVKWLQSCNYSTIYGLMCINKIMATPIEAWDDKLPFKHAILPNDE